MIIDKNCDRITVGALVEASEWHGIVVGIKRHVLVIEKIDGSICRHAATDVGDGMYRTSVVELVDA